MMEMPKPTEAHDVFRKMASSWTGEETLYPSPWDPAGALDRVSNARSRLWTAGRWPRVPRGGTLHP